MTYVGGGEGYRQFHQRFLRTFFVQKYFLAAFSSYILALAPKFRTKNTCVNVDEIKGRVIQNAEGTFVLF